MELPGYPLTHAYITSRVGRRPPLWPASECPGLVAQDKVLADCNDHTVAIWKCLLCDHVIVVDQTEDRLVNDYEVSP